MNFGKAIELLKQGRYVARIGWNGKGMWLALLSAPNSTHLGLPLRDCIGMKTADGGLQPGWLASQADMLAEDWIEVLH